MLNRSHLESWLSALVLDDTIDAGSTNAWFNQLEQRGSPKLGLPMRGRPAFPPESRRRPDPTSARGMRAGSGRKDLSIPGGRHGMPGIEFVVQYAARCGAAVRRAAWRRRFWAWAWGSWR